MTDLETRMLAPGEEIKKGDSVRTAKDSNAVLRMADGSVIEMRERSEFSVTENMRGVTWVVLEEVKSGDWGIGGRRYERAASRSLGLRGGPHVRRPSPARSPAHPGTERLHATDPAAVAWIGPTTR